MPKTPVTDSPPAVSHNRNGRGEEPHLLQFLTRLFDGLAARRDGDPSTNGHGPPLGRWEDSNYIYLEAILPGSPALEIDISAHEGRVLIRVGR